MEAVIIKVASAPSQALLLNLHQLLGKQHSEAVESTIREEGGDTTNVNQDLLNEEGQANTGAQVLHELHGSTEREHELTFDELDHYHGYHGDEADIELSL